MKSAAIVLGLALAVNAQVDNELAGFPSHPSGADLVRNAGWAHSQPIHVPPKHTNPTYWSKNDDVADDELVQTFYSPSGADLVKYAKQSQSTTYRPVAHVVRDDEGDDELYTYPYASTDRSLPIGHRTPIDYNTQYLNKYGLKHDDAADDEMMVYYTKDSRGVNHYQWGTSRDDAADDELLVNLWSPSGADLANHRGRPATDKHGRPYTDMKGNVLGPAVYRRDDEGDDELMVYYTKDSRGVNHYQWGTTSRDDAADDELVQTFYSPSGADLVKYAKQSQQTVYRPTAHVVRDDEGDDELMVYYTKDSRGNNHYQWGTTSRDDEADDELAYLGHLIKESEQAEKKPEIKRHFRHL